eukprot:COSAG05_NODE_765_length_7475_cov_6.478986_9_plen_35_part_01
MSNRFFCVDLPQFGTIQSLETSAALPLRSSRYDLI